MQPETKCLTSIFMSNDVKILLIMNSREQHNDYLKI